MVSRDLTVHCLVRNEERFVEAALRSVLPIASRVLVHDTGSTDRTLDIVKALDSDRIEFSQVVADGPKALTGLRNEMADRTDTEWFMLLDGDEIHSAAGVARIRATLDRMPDDVHRLILPRLDFVHSFNFVGPLHRIGRIFRTSRVRFRASTPPPGRPWIEPPYLREQPGASLEPCSRRLPEEAVFFHGVHLVRSSRDVQMGRMRRWRVPPFPVMPYAGPWPEVLDTEGARPTLSAGLLAQSIALNARVLLARRLGWTGAGLARRWAEPSPPLAGHWPVASA